MSTSAKVSLAVLLIHLPQSAFADDTGKALRDLHELNSVVIRAAALAQSRATQKDVRAYGRRLEMDHRFADYLVLDLAAQLGLEIGKTVTRRDGSDGPHEESDLLARLTELESLRGPEFELAFVRMMRAAHVHAIDTLSSAQRRSAPALVRMLDRMIPIFEQHVELAVHLSGSSEAHAER